MAFKTKAQLTEALVAEAVGAGKKVQLESVDFSDPNRPLTCLEVDFPILPINQIAQIEGNAGKPIYQMSKWWARRRSSVFRSMLIAAATKAPDDSSEAAKLVWDNYYANHQSNEAFRNLKVADIFMGGGTTLVEGSRLGMKVTGNDLNPVAWMVVKNELSDVNLSEVKKLFQYVENEVKPQILPFYTCDGPNGEVGIWREKSTGKVVDSEFDPLSIAPEERKKYTYEGPEIIYNFWAKHGPCSAPGCDHRTPLMSSPIVAVKSLTVKSWKDIECQHCNKIFDVERADARMAPDVPLVVSDTEVPYAIMDDAGYYYCPHCQTKQRDEAVERKEESSRLFNKMSTNKKVNLTLLVTNDWLSGSSGVDEQGKLGGTPHSECTRTLKWNLVRAKSLGLVEYRGDLPDEIELPGSLKKIRTGSGNISKLGTFVCAGATCGREQAVVKALKISEDMAPVSAFAIQGFSPRRKQSGVPYNGRFFRPISSDDVKRMNAAEAEWNTRKDGDLSDYWPRSEIPFGHMTHQRQPLPDHGYKYFSDFFNARQLLVLSILLKTIDTAHGFSDRTKEIVLGAFQQYVRNQNMMSFWHIKADKLASFMSNANYHPKSLPVESAVFPSLGLGNWESCVRSVITALEWKDEPWELIPTSALSEIDKDFAKLVSGKSFKVKTGDPVLPVDRIICGSSTQITDLSEGSLDMVITDPPFGDLLHYSELADFFYVWMKLFYSRRKNIYFSGEYSPKTLEAVSNKARHPDDPDAFYKRVLTECWREANRLLKPGGILAFTFHHSEDEPWVDVLKSLFDAGYYLEATYPIRSDETKGKGEFGSKTIEYDIIHVCRKRTEAPSKISWARLRRKILADVKQLQDLLEHHQTGGLPIADIQVIKRGKALEYFSRHYGQVYVEEGREFTVNEALVGINQILDDQSEFESGGTPVVCEPNTRQFLRIFSRQTSVERDQMQKFLRGSGIAPSTFIAFGWATETTRPKAFHWRSPLEFAQERMISKRNLSRDFDQAMLLVGACYPESGINTKKILNENFKPHPALGHLLDWLVHNGADNTMRTATVTARQLYTRWEAEHQSVVQQQISLFDMEDEV